MLKTDEVTKVLDRLVAEKGDIAFNSRESGCYYRTPEGEPLCIVGHVLAELEPEFFQALNTERNGLNGTNFDALSYEGEYVTAQEHARILLVEAQFHQDNGLTWAESVERAKKRLATLLSYH